MRQTFSGWVAAFAVVALGAGATPAMACGGGGGLLASPCSPCGQAYISPCGQSYYGGYGYGHYQRLAVPSPQYFWVNQGPVYDGPGQFAPRPYYHERTVTGWRGHYGYTGGPYANPINHYSYGGVAWRGPAITTYRWRGYARPASLRYGYHSHVSHRHGYRHAVRPGLRYDAGVRYGVSRGVRSSVRYGHAPHAMHHGGHAHHAMHHGAQRMMNPRVRQAPRFRDSGSYSYRSGFHQAPRARHHH